MTIQMQLWSIKEDRPIRLPSAKLGLEARLERWICHDLSLVSEDLLLLGSQIATDHGKAVDVLALDGDENLVILELKRGRTPRDVVAQVLDYASWAHGLSGQDIERIAEANACRAPGADAPGSTLPALRASTPPPLQSPRSMGLFSFLHRLTTLPPPPRPYGPEPVHPWHGQTPY